MCGLTLSFALPPYELIEVGKTARGAYLLAAVIVATISALASAVAACYSYWNVVK